LSGNVWPASVQNGLVLAASLKNGKTVSPQHCIAALSEGDSEIGIRALELRNRDGETALANSAVLEAIGSADAIVFGPGSFYSSILPHFLVGGIIPALLRNEAAPRIIVGNILQCPETRGRGLSELIMAGAELWQRGGGGQAAPFTHALANRVLFPFEKTVGSFPYLDSEGVASGTRDAMIGEFEDAWNRGQHDGVAIAQHIVAIAANAERKGP